MTECNQTAFPFEAHFSRRVEARFNGAEMTTDGGALLLRAVDKKIRLLQRVAACFRDGRAAQRIEHGLSGMLAQRIYGVALGYEDLNDHEELRHDPLLGVLAGKRELEQQHAESAGAYSGGGTAPVSQDSLFECRAGCAAGGGFLEAHRKPPREIVLDLDVTDLPLHGQREARFFRGYYGHYCYLPLFSSGPGISRFLRLHQQRST